jgi:MFS transporter, AAHS family, 4-hydroxybenzoate transporter
MKITTLQISTILICFLMNMLDGMDVMVVSYAAPTISKNWSISPQALGIVFSAGLLGMAIGAMFLGNYADKIGRKNIILLCCALMGVSVFATSYASSVEALIFFRIISGIGIGGMLASTATLVAEYSPKGNKEFWVSFGMSGYPIGAVLSGLVSGKIIPSQGWQTMFQVAGVATFITLPVVYFFLKESSEFLQTSESKKNPAVKELLTPTYQKATLYLWLAIFMAFATLYFLTLWTPKLASSMGLSTQLAIYAGTVFNLGAFFGILSQGYLSGRFGLQKIIFIYFIFTALLMIAFGYFKGSDAVLWVFGLLGFGIQGGFIGIYALAAKLYPTEIRATGVGWAIGAGRVGAIVGPSVAGLLIGAGISVATNFVVFAIPTLIAGLVTLLFNDE